MDWSGLESLRATHQHNSQALPRRNLGPSKAMGGFSLSSQGTIIILPQSLIFIYTVATCLLCYLRLFSNESHEYVKWFIARIQKALYSEFKFQSYHPLESFKTLGKILTNKMSQIILMD